MSSLTRKRLFDMAVEDVRTKIAAADHQWSLSSRQNKLDDARFFLGQAQGLAKKPKEHSLLERLSAQIEERYDKKKYGKCICGG